MCDIVWSSPPYAKQNKLPFNGNIINMCCYYYYDYWWDLFNLNLKIHTLAHITCVVSNWSTTNNKTNRKSACRVDLSKNILLLLERVNLGSMLFNHFRIFKNTKLKIHIYYLIISNKLCQSFGLFVYARTSVSARLVSTCIPYTFTIYFSLNLKLEIFATDPIRADPIAWNVTCKLNYVSFFKIINKAIN